MSPFGFRSFNRSWVNSRYSFATKTLIGCERGRVTNDMISCAKRGKMAARILAVRFSLCLHIPAKNPSRPSVVRCKMCSRHTIHLWTHIIVCKRHIISLDLSVHQLDVFGINTVEFRCQAKVEETEAAMCKGNEAGDVSNAFNLLIGSGMTRAFFDLGLTKVNNPFLPYFEEHNKSFKCLSTLF